MHRKNKCAVRCYRAALLTLTKLPISIVLSDLYKLPCFCPKQRNHKHRVFHSIFALLSGTKSFGDSEKPPKHSFRLSILHFRASSFVVDEKILALKIQISQTTVHFCVFDSSEAKNIFLQLFRIEVNVRRN